MQYILPVRVRYSETDIKGNLFLHKMLDYFQDTSIFHSDSLGYPVKQELAMDRGWFLLSWNISIIRMPVFGEHLHIITEPYKMRGFYGYRRFYIRDEKGKQIVQADSIWILMNIKSLTPQRIPKDIVSAYIDDIVDDEIRVKRKLPEQGEWETKETITITKQYLDSNSHVNNAYYAMWAQQNLPEDAVYQEVKIDYRKSTFINDILTISFAKEEKKYRFRFTNQEGILIALIEFV